MELRFLPAVSNSKAFIFNYFPSTLQYNVTIIRMFLFHNKNVNYSILNENIILEILEFKFIILHLEFKF